MADEISELIRRLRDFGDRRGWAAEHMPKELAVSLAIEAGELLACFQWRAGGEIDAKDIDAVAAIRGEVADVLIYLLQLADTLGIDPIAAALDKIRINERRFPAA